MECTQYDFSVGFQLYFRWITNKSCQCLSVIVLMIKETPFVPVNSMYKTLPPMDNLYTLILDSLDGNCRRSVLKIASSFVIIMSADTSLPLDSHRYCAGNHSDLTRRITTRTLYRWLKWEKVGYSQRSGEDMNQGTALMPQYYWSNIVWPLVWSAFLQPYA